MAAFKWFQRELDAMMPNRELRLVRDPHRLGLDLWCVERKVPGDVHAAEVEALRRMGEERFHSAVSETLGMVRYDLAPEWRIVHICKSETCQHTPPQFSQHDPECQRDPNQRDLQSISRWLYEFRNFEQSLESIKRESREKTEAMERNETEAYAKAIKSAPFMTDRVFGDAPKTTFKKSTEGTLWLPQ